VVAVELRLDREGLVLTRVEFEGVIDLAFSGLDGVEAQGLQISYRRL